LKWSRPCIEAAESQPKGGGVELDFLEFMLVMCITLPIMVLWLGCIIDVIGRPDISGLAKAGWMLFVLFLPLIGAIVYAIMRPPTIMAKNVGIADEAFTDPTDPALAGRPPGWRPHG
jgi:hypothetical protein